MLQEINAIWNTMVMMWEKVFNGDILSFSRDFMNTRRWS